MAKSADAADLKSADPKGLWGFKSPSRHHLTQLEAYLNLARRAKLTGVDQLWVADITYIRLKTEFVYLAVILDAFSRRVVGWSLDRNLASRLSLAALAQAIATRQPLPGLIHHF